MWPLLLPSDCVVFYSGRSACTVVKNWYFLTKTHDNLEGRPLPIEDIHSFAGYALNANQLLTNTSLHKAIVVREPVARFVSALRHSHVINMMKAQGIIPEVGTIADYVLNHVEAAKAMNEIEHHFEPQYMTFDGTETSVWSYFEKIIRVEDGDIIAALNDWYHSSVPSFRMNESKGPMPYITRDQVDRIKRVYRLDYENFYPELL